jgi:hypothetical protein
MKRFAFSVSIILTLGGVASIAQAAWVYGYPGSAWSGGWRQGGFRPAYRIGFAVPMVVIYPVSGSYYGRPAYGYPYVPAAYPYVQPAYAYQPAQAYGRVPAPVAAAPSPGLAFSAQVSRYAATGQRLYRPAAPVRTVAAAAPSVSANKSKLAAQEKRVNDELIRVKVERNQARTELSLWTTLGVTREQIKGFQEQLAKLQAENNSLVRRNNELECQLSWYVGPEKEVKMPAGLRGKIMAVDPKYQFAVLNIGRNQGVAKDGKLLVNRDGRLVGKLRVTTVESNSSIANILPEWKVTDVMEGDEVIHQ